ncbi:MAG: MerR family transcriptional regulator [Deltaproteobacteria bacterium]|nr:MerR family transcriptional regulator [Deltaproteobacteria bacterium]
MSDLVARSGVEKSTIQHYLREGLLPEPAERPHRNMAYYSPAVVERIGLIRKLQNEQRLTLSKIKQLLAGHSSTAELRHWLARQDLVPEPVTQPVSRDELLSQSGIGSSQLDRLEQLGFLRPTREEQSLLYSPNDVAVVRSVAAMRRAGLNEDNGFQLDDMLLYLDAMRRLVMEELALFSRAMGDAGREKIVELAEAGIEGTTGLLLGLRRRIQLDLLVEDDGTEPE